MSGAEDTGLNLATVWETVADIQPTRPALIHGERVTTWGEFDSRAARLAGHLDARGIGHGDNVALYLHNCPEYLESTHAVFKVRAATVNVNYRYLESELRYLFENSESVAIIFDAAFAERVDSIRGQLDRVRTFICVGADEVNLVPDWAVSYDEVVATTEAMDRIERSDQDLWLLYTGGTTGSPKGVMWPHSSLLQTAAATFAVVKRPIPTSVDEVADALRAFADLKKWVKLLPAAPLMHGTSAITALGVLCAGGTVVTLTSRSFDADELWHAVQANRVSQLTIVGDAFAKPMLQSLEEAAAAGQPFDISSLRVVLSSGVMWSKESKDAIHDWTSATLADSLGSSEGVGFATSVSRRGSSVSTARFVLGPNAGVFTDDGRRVMPGSGERGLLAVGGAIPIGYYNDPAKSAETFRTFEGRVWSVPGDFAEVEADGTIRLLGRGSACINTAGEKVYPEEVEEALKSHPGVRDANVVGVPDDKWGSAVHAVVSLAAGTWLAGTDSQAIEATLINHCREKLSGYKCPKVIHLVDEVERGPNGKPDYKWAFTAATGSASQR